MEQRTSVQESNLRHDSDPFTLQHTGKDDPFGGLPCDERKEPDFVKFDKPGFLIAGRLLRVDQIAVDEGKSRACRYTVEEGVVRGGGFVPGGSTVAFLGVYAIDSALRTTDIGHFIAIRYEGEDANVGRNGNKMKKFTIRVSRNVVETADFPF